MLFILVMLPIAFFGMALGLERLERWASDGGAPRAPTRAPTPGTAPE